MELRPIKIRKNMCYADFSYSYSLHKLSEYMPYGMRYKHNLSKYWKSKTATYKEKGDKKGIDASRIVELRKQFIPYCCDDDFDPEHNNAVGRKEGSKSEQDVIYRWHFVHRHGFPSDINGSGRGQGRKATDILNHPLSYMLMCNEHHEEYDRENGEWRNPKNHKR